MVVVTAAIVIDSLGRVLVGRRPAGKKLGGMWEFPGGKVEPGETPEEALARELREELGVGSRAGNLLAENTHGYEFGTIRLLAYETTLETGDLQKNAHEELRWVPVSDIEKLDLTPADRPLVPHICQLAAERLAENKK